MGFDVDPVSLAQGAMKIMPPRVAFGSPVQRSMDERQSWWHIPIHLLPFCFIPDARPECRPFVQLFEGGALRATLRMKWGDAGMIGSGQLTESIAMQTGRVYLVPIIYRAESGDDDNAYITDSIYLDGYGQKTVFTPGQRKYRLKLLLETGKHRVISKHSYLTRVPSIRGNSNFTLEIEYEGFGTSG